MDEPTTKRRWFRFSLRGLFLEVVWIALALGMWVLLDHAEVSGLAVTVIAFYTACGAAIGGLVGRAGWGAVTGAILSSLLMVAMEIWPPTDL